MQFDRAFTLTQVMRQAGNDPGQVRFRDILLRLRNADVTQEDWEELMKQTPTNVADLTPFADALHLYPTVEAVVEHNISKLKDCGQSIASIKAVHTGANAAKASSDDAGSLEAVVCLAKSARVMLTSNLWVKVGLVNGAMGIIEAICYKSGGPPDLPLAVMVKFDHYSGPTLQDGTVPITPLRRTWSNSGVQCSRLQLPLKLAWTITIHKSQGLTLNKVVIDVGKKEFSCGLTFVACSRVRQITDLLFSPPFSFQRLSNLSNSQRLRERQLEDQRLLSLQPSTEASHTDEDIPSPSKPPTSPGMGQDHSECSYMYLDLPSPSPFGNPPSMHEDWPSPSPSDFPPNMDEDWPSPSPSDFPPNMDEDWPSPSPSDFPPNMDEDWPSPSPSDFPPNMDEDWPSPSPSDFPPNMDEDWPSPSPSNFSSYH